MNFKELYSAIDEFAPFSLSDEMREREDCYDNSGVIAETDREIKKVVFCLDLTSVTARFAAEEGADAIITHHPAIYEPIKNIRKESPLLICAQNGIGVISAHLNLDSAKRGIDYYFAEGLGGKEKEIYQSFAKAAGYGRISVFSGVTFGTFAENFKKAFGTEKVFLYGDTNRKINAAASFCGAGLDENAVDFAALNGADAVVSADISHHVLLYALEKGLCVLECTHYASENYGMKKFSDDFGKKYGKNIEIIYCDDERFV